MCDGHTDKQEAHNKMPRSLCLARVCCNVDSLVSSDLRCFALTPTAASGERRREIEWEKCQQEKPSCDIVHKLVPESSA